MNNEPKTQRIEIRLSQHDKEKIERMAKKLKITKSDFLRHAINSCARRETVEIDVSPLKVCTYEMRKQGTNLNQLLYFLNSHSRECTPEMIEQVRATMRKQANVCEALLCALDEVNRKSTSAGVVLVNEEVDMQKSYVYAAEPVTEKEN